MNDFIDVQSHERFTVPVNAGDVRVKENMQKYITERNVLASKYDELKITMIENQYLKDDFEFWWYQAHRSYINKLIKLMKSECRS